jgi:hypothetical protein
MLMHTAIQLATLSAIPPATDPVPPVAPQRRSFQMLFNDDTDYVPLCEHQTGNSIMIQFVHSLCHNIRHLIDLFLCSTPIPDINSIPNTGKECLIIARPSLWCKEHMFELCAIQ